MKLKKYLNEAFTFKKGDKVTWKAPDGTGMQGVVISGDIRGKLKVMPDIPNMPGKKFEPVLVVTKTTTNLDQLKKRMKSGSAAMTHYDTM